ncbi:hypothetical protein [Lysobacter tyrosinilyticus]
MIDDGKCLEWKDGRILVDGKEQSVAPLGPRMSLPAAPAGVARIAVVYDRKLLANIVIDQKKDVVVPQFYLVDLKTGKAAVTGDLAEPLARFASTHATPASNALHASSSPALLDSLIAASRHADGTLLQRSELDGKRFAAFQLWASWCRGCMDEANELSALLRKHPMPELAWVALETDPEALNETGEAQERGEEAAFTVLPWFAPAYASRLTAAACHAWAETGRSGSPRPDGSAPSLPGTSVGASRRP